MKLLKLVPDDTNIKFLKWRVPFYVVSVLLIIASWGAVYVNGLNYGVDFAGGQEVRVTFVGQEEAPVEELRAQIGSMGLGDPVIQRFGAPKTRGPSAFDGFGDKLFRLRADAARVMMVVMLAHR